MRFLGAALLLLLTTASTARADGLWIRHADLLARPTSGPAWTGLLAAAKKTCTTPNLANQDDPANVCIMAKALVAARTGDAAMKASVLSAIGKIANGGTYSGRALALGRELAAYVIAADLIDLKTADPALDVKFRAKLKTLLTTPTSGGPTNLITCAEGRPNNWGTNCAATVTAVAIYLGDTARLTRAVQVFKGWLGDRNQYAKFTYGDKSWQCNSATPVGINPKGCTKAGHNVDGVLPDDQRRGGSFAWPPRKEPYVWGALQGTLAQAILLKQAGYDPFAWSDQAILRAFTWVHDQAHFPAEGDDTWQPSVANFYYGTHFPAPSPSKPGKNVGWTDWTHGR